MGIWRCRKLKEQVNKYSRNFHHDFYYDIEYYLDLRHHYENETSLRQVLSVFFKIVVSLQIPVLWIIVRFTNTGEWQLRLTSTNIFYLKGFSTYQAWWCANSKLNWTICHCQPLSRYIIFWKEKMTLSSLCAAFICQTNDDMRFLLFDIQ